MNGRQWSKSEIRLLKEKYVKYGSDIPELNRTASAIRSKASRLGLLTDMRNHIQLTGQLREFLNGLLLGDGCIYNYNPGTAYYNHCDNHEKYLIWLKKQLEFMGLPCNTIYKPNFVFILRSESAKELQELYHKWYPNGNKRIPENLKITPTVLKNWYIGDGTYSKQSRGNGFILKITCYFDPIGKERLVNQINRDTPVEAHNNKNIVYIPVDSYGKFFSYILSDGLEIPPGYKYKFPDKYM